MTIWTYFRLPETMGRSFHEFDILFAKKVSARKFRSTNVDAFDDDDIQVAAAENERTPGSKRPSFVPSLTAVLAKTGKDEAFNQQQRASMEASENGGSRRPSIAPAVSEYLAKSEKEEK